MSERVSDGCTGLVVAHSRITIYEALNAVPPSVAASVHHVTSILLMRFDYGAIHGLIGMYLSSFIKTLISVCLMM